MLWKGTISAKFPGNLPEAMRKLRLSTKILHQEIGCNHGIFRSDSTF